METSTTQLGATLLFALAVAHTFVAGRIRKLGHAYPSGSIPENLFHLLGEVEVVFGLWAGVLLGFISLVNGYDSAVRYVEGLNFTEPAFVFVIMSVAATDPILRLANAVISGVARLLPLRGESAFVFSALVLGPLMGSFITEPAAMTVTALLLRDRLFANPAVESNFKYFALGVLFVNISIGGVLTPYAAPPVLMVAAGWGWDFPFMLGHFGWKAAIAVVINASLVLAVGSKTLRKLKAPAKAAGKQIPGWLMALHALVLFGVVMNAHHVPMFMGLFLFFLAVVGVTAEYQSAPKLKESLLVASFLAGLVVLGGLQSWWLSPLLASLSEPALYLGATALTAITDNAALTYLGAQVTGLSDAMKYVLVAGAVAGGGLTVIANAPNPAGFSILQKSFGRDGVSPLRLFLGAAVPTAVAVAALWLFPHLSI